MLVGLFAMSLLYVGSMANESLRGTILKNSGDLIEAITVLDPQLSLASQGTEMGSTAPQTDDVPPKANAGEDRIVGEGEETILDGSASMDEDGTVEHYSWILEDTDDNCDPAVGNLIDPNKAKTKFVAPREIPQEQCTYYYQLEVKDNNGLVDSDDVIVRVKSANTDIVNKPPVAHAGKDRQIHEGESVRLDGTSSTDEDGDIVSYRWNIEEWDDEDPPGKITNLNSAKTNFVAPKLKDPPGIYGIDLTVEDNDGGIGLDTVIIRVSAESSKSKEDSASDRRENGERTLSENNESRFQSYSERSFYLNPFTLLCRYGNQTSELIACNILCCSQTANFTNFISNETLSDEEEKLKQFLNHSLVILDNTTLIGKLVPFNGTEIDIAPNATSLLSPFLTPSSYSKVPNNLSASK
jgi:hypothetical protein